MGEVMNFKAIKKIKTKSNEIHVLVIEDNPADIRILEYSLAGEFDGTTYQITPANTLSSGLQLVESFKFNIALLDLNLPDSAGLDTLRKFNSTHPNTPVIVLTGTSDDGTGKEAIRMGAQDYMVKGEFNDSMIRKVIDFSIERQQINKMLYEQDYKYRYIFDNSLDAIFIASRGAKKFNNFNTSLQRMLGYERNELFEIKPIEIFKDSNSFFECSNLFMRNGFIKNKEIELLDKHGATIHCLINVNDVRDLNQRIIGLQGIVTDITSLKQQKEKLLLLNQDLERKVIFRTKELLEAKQKVDEKNKLVESSINYAQNIQNALLPTMGEVRELVDNSFLIFKPRDTVSGDFYWINQIGNKTIYIIGDCTGHGVPGAFMSFIGVQQLNEIICEGRQTDPSKILFELNHRVNRLLKKDERESHEIHEGMDIGVCVFNFQSRTLEYASARRPLYITREEEIWEIKGTPVSIGENTHQVYESKKILLNEEDNVYLFTDGYADQIGGTRNKKFMRGRFRSLLQSLQGENIDAQKMILEREFEEWKADEIQIDDVCGFGLQIS